MKKVTTVFYFLVVAVVAANAQFFVEGSVGVLYSESTTSNDVFPLLAAQTILKFNASPVLGYQLNDKFAVGVKATFSKQTEKMSLLGESGDVIESETQSDWKTFSVFNRYKLWGTQKFSLLLESSIFFDKYNYSGREPQYGSNSSGKGVNVLPLVTYDLSEKFNFIVRCDFLDFEFRNETTITKAGTKTKDNRLRCGLSSDIFTSLFNISLGIIYKF